MLFIGALGQEIFRAARTLIEKCNCVITNIIIIIIIKE
jgi:hypothetical protein